MVKLQPQSVNFLEISDPKAVLERAFRNFATLTKGDVFNFEYNDEVYDVAVLDVKPETDKMGVSMIETDVSVEFAPPIGYVEPGEEERHEHTSQYPCRSPYRRSLTQPRNHGASHQLQRHRPVCDEHANQFLWRGDNVLRRRAARTRHQSQPRLCQSTPQPCPNGAQEPPLHYGCRRTSFSLGTS